MNRSPADALDAEEKIAGEEPEKKKKKKRKKKFFTRKRKRQLKYTGLFVLFMLGLLMARKLYLTYDRDPVQPQSYTEKLNVRFSYGYDGDTAIFTDEEGGEIVCRFLAVDTPEIGEDGYSETKQYTASLLSSSYEVVLELDPHADRYDTYGRLLAWVWADGRLVQGKLVENGLATLRYLEDSYLYAGYLYRMEKKDK